MKKLLGILVLGLLLSSNAIADQSLIKIIDIYTKRSDELKKNNVDPDSHLFLQEELKVATDKITKVGRPCYREVLKNKLNYNSNTDCLKFRVLLGNDSDEWIVNLNKLMAIFNVHKDLADNNEWLDKWPEKKFSKFTKLGNEIVANVAVANELITLVTDK